MRNQILYFTLLTGLCLASPALADSQRATIHPFVKGSFAQIQAQNSGKPFLLVFWSEICTYCMEELTLLGKMQKNYHNSEIVVVATDPFLDEEIVWQTLATHNLQLAETWVFGEYFPEKIYREVDSRWRGELPLTYFVDAQGNKYKHMGIVNEEILQAWFERPEL